MKHLMCLLLPFATMVLTAPIRDTLGTTTEKAIPANTTEYPTPKNEQESEAANSVTERSEAKSTANYGSNGFTDALKGLDSDVTKYPKAEEKYAAPSGDKTHVGSMDLSSVPVQGSREQSGPHEKQKASGEEGVMVEAQEVEHLSGKPVVCLSKDRVTGSVQRKATPGRVHGLNGMLAPGPDRVPLDWDSLEYYHNGRPAPVGIRGDPDYDESREFMSHEMYPIVPPEQSHSTFAVPAKIRATV
ncbi:uncharacterized protein [Pseudochaenichthys georgianus]|uniref:uncharacterized protein isoform X2 n=1 Tax=Pseudochaenichthys georgianus TaxID=52239 RepID=UPI00146D68A1|nr:uncharacterized protein LOC117460901 isoform X2 [Pseudochaenichthys georgianus]XP_033958410.1 uncharacterized protein LOC117460901 isoform X2 [Pseudochaenichthys georgianus]